MKSESGIDYQLLYTYYTNTKGHRNDDVIKSIFLPILKAKKYKSLLNEPTVDFYIEYSQLSDNKYLYRIRLSIEPNTIGYSENIFIVAICTRDLETYRITDVEEYYPSSLTGEHEGSFDIKIDFS